jgi:hypothetical protein
MSVLITKATPAPGVAKMRVPEDVWSRWPEHIRLLRTCQHCGTTYRAAGAANVCEHFHEGCF